jgi:hypothetical protein
MLKQGDYIRFIHEKEEGKIVKVLSNNTFEIETSDGFRMQAYAQQIVKVDVELSKEEINPEKMTTGIHLAILPFNDQWYDVMMVNDTAQLVYFQCIEQVLDHKFTNLFHGNVPAFTSTSIHRLNWTQLQHEFKGKIQAFMVHSESNQLPHVIQQNFKITGLHVLKSNKAIPLLLKQGYSIKLEEDKIEVNKIQQPTKNNPTTILEQIDKPLQTVDLHIEKLSEQVDKLSNNEKLQLQLTTFEKSLENAYAHGYDSITFIHGIGNGILKNEIHKRISKNTKIVKSFEDAQKEKFGYGATLIYFKK